MQVGSQDRGVRRLFGPCVSVVLMFYIFAMAAEGHIFAADAPAKKFSVVLSEPAKVGDERSVGVTCAGKTRFELAVAGRAPIVKERSYDLILEGVSTVLEVDSKSNCIKASCRVKRFTCNTNGVQTDVLPTGSVVVADRTTLRQESKNSSTRFSLKDGELSPEQAALLDYVLTLSAPESPTSDEVFGTDGPQLVGASWQIKPELGVKWLLSQGLIANAENFEGQTKLAGIEKVDGKEFLNVEVGLDGKKSSFQFAPNLTGEIHMRASQLRPLEGDASVNFTKGDYSIHLSGPGKAQGDAETFNYAFHPETRTKPVIKK